MPDIPAEVHVAYQKAFWDRMKSFGYDYSDPVWHSLNAALEAAAPLLAEAWGLDPDPPSAAALRAYLRSHGWAERPPGQAGSLFDLPGTSAVVAVLHEGAGDCDRRFLAETLKRVAEAEGRTPWQVASDIPEVPGP